MKKSKFTEAQILKALKEYENGRTSEDVCRELSITRNTFYRWKKQYSGMDGAQIAESGETAEKLQIKYEFG